MGDVKHHLAMIDARTVAQAVRAARAVLEARLLTKGAHDAELRELEMALYRRADELRARRGARKGRKG